MILSVDEFATSVETVPDFQLQRSIYEQSAQLFIQRRFIRKKTDLHYTRGMTPKCGTAEVHFRGLELRQNSSEEAWQAVGTTV